MLKYAPKLFWGYIVLHVITKYFLHLNSTLFTKGIGVLIFILYIIYLTDRRARSGV